MEIKVGNTKLWIDYDKWKYQQEWYEYREKLVYLVGIDPTKERLLEAEEYLTTNYPQYNKFKI